MPDKKLPDSEIVKALEVCCTKRICKECIYLGNKEFCIADNTIAVLDLFNRLQAENERLQKRVDEYNIQVVNQREQIEKYEPIKETLCVLWENMLSISVARGKEKPTLEELAEAVDYIKAKAYKEFAEAVDYIKAKAYKEFAEKLKKKAHNCFMGKDKAVTVDNIDNLLKELVGEDNERTT